jgi:hypothetical protein
MAPFETNEIDAETKKNIVDWMIGRLMTTHQGNPLTVIFKGEMSLISADLVQWSTEFHQIFKEKAAGMTEPIGKIVFLFQEIKNGKTKIKDDLFEEEPIEKEANIIITPFVEPIRPSHIEEWIGQLPESIRKTKNGTWTAADFRRADAQNDEYSYSHPEFIEVIFTKFEIDNDGKAEIMQALYDF